MRTINARSRFLLGKYFCCHFPRKKTFLAKFNLCMENVIFHVLQINNFIGNAERPTKNRKAQNFIFRNNLFTILKGAILASAAQHQLHSSVYFSIKRKVESPREFLAQGKIRVKKPGHNSVNRFFIVMGVGNYTLLTLNNWNAQVTWHLFHLKNPFVFLEMTWALKH